MDWDQALRDAVNEEDLKATKAALAEGGTPTVKLLSTAIQLRKKAIAKALLKAGVSTAGQDGKDTVLHDMAECMRDGKMVPGVVAGGVDVNATNGYGQTAIHMAIHQKKRDFVEALVAAGADVNAPMSKRPFSTALHIACETQSGRMTDGEEANALWLLENGADPNATDSNGDTPLDRAAQYATVTVVQALFEHGAKLGAESTALHVAAAYFNESRDGLLRLLIDRGADLEGRNKSGATPLIAAATSSTAGVARLLELGADRGAKRDDGMTALEAAQDYGRADIVKLLE